MINIYSSGVAGVNAQVAPDYKGDSWMDFMQSPAGVMGLDYNSNSIGIDFGVVTPGIKKIKLTPGGSYQNHRISENTLGLYTSSNNALYSLIPKSSWVFEKDVVTGIITITFNETFATRYLKVHVSSMTGTVMETLSIKPSS